MNTKELYFQKNKNLRICGNNMNYKQHLEHNIFKIISQAAQELNLECYVIGGFVRDILLNRDHKKDIDIVAVGSGIELALKVSQLISFHPKVQVFKNYGTAMLRYDDIDVEFVGARKESYTHDSRNPLVENGTLKDDQVKNKIIKTPLNPDITYSDDPLRMMRAIRFATQLNFEIESESLEAISKNKDRINIISGERIVDELHKILASEKPSIGFLHLYQTGLLDIFLPELTALNNVEEVEGHTHKNNFYHTLEVVDNICPNTDDVWLRWSALLHDIGKAPTKRFNKKQGWTFHGHEFLGGKMVKKIFERLHMPLNHKMKFVQKMVMMSSRPIVIAEDIVTDSAVRRLVFDAGEDIDSLMTLCKADITTKNPKKFQKYHKNFDIVKEKIVEVEEKDRVRVFQPPISGEEIMELFGLKPCREIGILKEAVKEAILEGEIPNEYESAKEFVLNKASKLGLKKV